MNLYNLLTSSIVANLVRTPFFIHGFNRQNLRIGFQISQHVLTIPRTDQLTNDILTAGNENKHSLPTHMAGTC